jgi:Mitochondrial carrier protein
MNPNLDALTVSNTSGILIAAMASEKGKDAPQAPYAWSGGWITARDYKEMLESAERGARVLAAGGFAGAASKTTVAPLERLKVLLQIQAQQVPEASKRLGARELFWRVIREEGVLALWKGNDANVLRIVPNKVRKYLSLSPPVTTPVLSRGCRSF